MASPAIARVNTIVALGIFLGVLAAALLSGIALPSTVPPDMWACAQRAEEAQAEAGRPVRSQAEAQALWAACAEPWRH